MVCSLTSVAIGIPVCVEKEAILTSHSSQSIWVVLLISPLESMLSNKAAVLIHFLLGEAS